MRFLFLAKSGVLTGCPLSASLFVIALNPFLLDFHKTVVSKSHGVLYAWYGLIFFASGFLVSAIVWLWKLYAVVRLQQQDLTK